MIHPYLRRRLVDARSDDFKRAADARRRGPRRGAGAALSDVTIRISTRADRPKLATLAALDDTSLPVGRLLIAEIDGVPRAALPLEGGRPFADPFRRTCELIALLELRAEQIIGPRPRSRGRALAQRVLSV